jgi:hypothetical protein
VTFKRRVALGLLFAGLCVLALVGVVLNTFGRKESR